MAKVLTSVLFLFLLIGDQIPKFMATASIPVPDVEQCRRLLVQSPPASKLTTLAYVIGVGWDNLRNTPMSTVYDTSFKECKTTPDSTFLLPDGLSALPVQKSQLDRMASFYQTYHDYFDSTTDSINLEAGAFFGQGSISGKFSKTHTEIKERSINRNTSIFRSRLHYHAYTLIGPSNAGLYSTYKNRLIDIGKAIKATENRTARYLSRLVIRDYGTHVISRAEMGAELSQDDYVDMNSIVDKRISIDDMKASAATSFLIGGVNLSSGISVGRTVSKQTVDAFLSTVQHTQVNTRGGPNVNRLVTSAAGGNKGNSIDLLIDNIVALDRFGEPLYFTATQENLPELSPWIVWQVALYLRNATEEYYIRNTRYGCTDQWAENFDINANVDDGSCRQPFHNYTFGGLYQRCWTDGYDSECDRANQPNGITGAYSCPSLYSEIELLRTREYYTCCHTETTWIFFHKRVCRNCYRQLNSFWCNANKSIRLPSDSGYMFGGLYSLTQMNPYTGSATCPGRFVGVRLSFDLTVCLSREYETDQRYSIRLGHFFSCSTPKNESGCPIGYSQHLATILDGCEVYYCVRPDKDDQPKILPAHRPPYGEFLFREKMADIDVTPSNNQAPSIRTSNDNALGGGSIAGIILGSVGLLIIIAALALFLHKRKQNGYKKLSAVGEREHIVQAQDTATSYQTIGSTNETA